MSETPPKTPPHHTSAQQPHAPQKNPVPDIMTIRKANTIISEYEKKRNLISAISQLENLPNLPKEMETIIGEFLKNDEVDAARAYIREMDAVKRNLTTMFNGGSTKHKYKKHKKTKNNRNKKRRTVGRKTRS